MLEIIGIPEEEKEDFVVVGPDLGRESQSARVAQELGAEIVSLNKKRINDATTVFEFLTKEQIKALSGKRVIIFDDLIASGGTLENIWDLIGTYVESITVVASHALFIKGAVEKLSQPGFAGIAFLDTRRLLGRIPSGDKFRLLSCVPLMNRFLRADMRGGFNPWQDDYFKNTVSAV